MGLKRYQQVFLSELKIGDRFYFTKKKNEVCEFAGINRFSIRDNPEYLWIQNKKDHSSKKDKIVVYLRNIND